MLHFFLKIKRNFPLTWFSLARVFFSLFQKILLLILFSALVKEIRRKKKRGRKEQDRILFSTMYIYVH